MVNIKVLSEHCCIYCKHTLKSSAGIKRHMLKCKKRPSNTDQPPLSLLSPILSNTSKCFENIPYLPEIDIFPPNPATSNKSWGNMSLQNFLTSINSIYDEVVKYRRNIFNLPSGRAGKEFITELTFWLKQFNSESHFNQISIKVFMILPSILLQKPSPKSKSKDHTACLIRRIELWRHGNLTVLLKEIRNIQSKFVNSKKTKSVEEISRIFAKNVMEGKISSAIKYLDRESSSGVISLSDSVMKELKEKHPEAAPISDNILLHGPIDLIPSCFFDSIDETLVFKAALNTKGSAGPSGMDGDLYRRILCSKNYGKIGKELREEIALLARNLLTKNYHHDFIEAYVSSRLIPLDKKPGIRPIGVGEVLRRIIGKMVSWTFGDEIKRSAGPLQTCANHSAGSEAAIHSMKVVFDNEATDAILLIDASNAFNSMNRNVAMHNIRVTCPVISTYVINTYRHSSRLFVSGGEEIASREGTTQGDP